MSDTAGAAVAATLGEATAVVAGVMATEGEGTVPGIVGLGRGLGVMDGRTLGDASAAGVAVAADGATVAATLGEITAVAAGVMATEGEGTGDTAIVGLGLGLGVPDGRTLGDAEVTGVVLASAVAETAGVGLDALAVGEAAAGGVGVGLILAADGEGLAARGVGLAAAAGVGVAAVVAGVLVAPAVAAVAGVAEGVASTGLTNFFGGAFGGGVASVLNLLRTRSAADRSLISVQPLSTFTSVTRSLTRRGRIIFRTSLRIGIETCNSAPLTRAGSTLRSRRRR